MTTQSRKIILPATDLQNSVLNVLDANRLYPTAYTPYGHCPLDALLSLLGFTGELIDPLTGHYHLGNGYRQFNPVLMRFNSPDGPNFSPFGKGGLNSYTYCLGDPVNRVELEGHASSLLMKLWKGFRNRIGVRTPSKFDIQKPAPVHTKMVNPPKSAQQPLLKKPQMSALENAKNFDLNSLSPDELALNYKPNIFDGGTKIKGLNFPIRASNITDPSKKLANLKLAKDNILKRLASDQPDTRERRQLLLDNINNDITQITKQVKLVRNPHPTISI
jgi:RHS repeat-associated protein